MEWIRVEDSLPCNKENVLIKLSNGKEINGHRINNFWSFNPKEHSFEDLKAEVIEWKRN